MFYPIHTANLNAIKAVGRSDLFLRLEINVYFDHGIALDPTYTGKAYFGMIDHIKKNKITDKNVLFIHTGGLPIFFDKYMRFLEEDNYA